MYSKFYQAMEFAKLAHKDQKRKYTNEAYLSHPIAVAGLVFSVTNNDDMLAAAALHDVVEDTPVTIKEIRYNFGLVIASMVDDLTDISKPEDGNRKKRKNIDLLHTKAASPESKTIKLADLIDNTKSIVSFDPDFARVYMHEKKRLLEVLTEGDSTLLEIAVGLIDRYYKIRGKHE